MTKTKSSPAKSTKTKPEKDNKLLIIEGNNTENANKPATLGRPPAFKTPEQMQAKINEYYEYCKANNKPLTMSGLGNSIGLSRQGICNYSNKDAFIDTIKRARDIVEQSWEERLLSQNGNVAGVIFAFKNNFGWTDKQEIESKSVNANIELSNLSIEEIKQLLSKS